MEKNLAYLLEQIRGCFYYCQIKDRTRLKISYDQYRLDKSLKGEFIRLMEQAKVREEEKDTIIRMGLKALAGGGADRNETDILLYRKFWPSVPVRHGFYGRAEYNSGRKRLGKVNIECFLKGHVFPGLEYSPKKKLTGNEDVASARGRVVITAET